MGFLRRNEARRAVVRELPPDVQILAEGSALFMFSDGVRSTWPEVHVVVTETHIGWAMLKHPDVGAPTMQLSRIVRYADDGSAVRLTERDPSYAAELNDATNPHGETDAVFRFDGSAGSNHIRRVLSEHIRVEHAGDATANLDLEALLSTRDLTDIPEAVRIGSPYDADDADAIASAKLGFLHPQTNYGVVYRIAFATRLEPREEPITTRVMLASSEPAAVGVLRKPTRDDMAWLLVTSFGLRWHFAVDGIPGTPPHPEAPRPAGPRAASYASLRPESVSLPREFVSESAGPFGGASFDFFGFLQSIEAEDWLHVFSLSPGFETDALMNEIHERIAIAHDAD